jgi:hypothetical protein
LQPGPRKDLNQSNWSLARQGREAEMRRPNSSGGGRQRRGELAEKDQGTRGNLVGGDVMVGVDRRG